MDNNAPRSWSREYMYEQVRVCFFFFTYIYLFTAVIMRAGRTIAHSMPESDFNRSTTTTIKVVLY